MEKKNRNCMSLLENDVQFIESLGQNIVMLLQIGKHYLNYEYLAGMHDYPDRYIQILQKMMNQLNEPENITLIQTDYLSNLWQSFIYSIISIHKCVFQHLYRVNQDYHQNMIEETVYLQTFKAILSQQLGNVEISIEGVRQFARLRWKQANRIIINMCWNYPFLQEMLKKETVTNKIADMKNCQLDNGGYNDTESAATFYFFMLFKCDELYEPLFQNYSDFSENAKKYIYEKFPALLKRYQIPQQTLINLLKTQYIRANDIKLVYQVLDNSRQLKNAKTENKTDLSNDSIKEIVQAFDVFIVNYQQEMQVFRFIDYYTSQDLEIIFPVLYLLKYDKLKKFIDHLYCQNRTLIQTYLVRLHLEPVYNNSSNNGMDQTENNNQGDGNGNQFSQNQYQMVQQFIQNSQQLIFNFQLFLSFQELVNVLNYLSKQFIQLNHHVVQTLTLSFQKFPSEQELIQVITEFLRKIQKQEGQKLEEMRSELKIMARLDPEIKKVMEQVFTQHEIQEII